MNNITLLFSCLLIGMILRKLGRMPDNAHTSLNAFIINVSLPALTLSLVHEVRLDYSLIYAVSMPWLLFGVSAALFALVGSTFRLSTATTGALIVVSGLGNTSFIGLPMIEAFYGSTGMPIGILIDQLGTYLVLSTVGIVIICNYAEGVVTSREIVKRVATFPPLIALGLALALLPVEYPEWAITILKRLSGTLAPLALVSVGLQLRLSSLPGHRFPLALGLGFKLVFAPLMIALIYVWALGLRGSPTQVTLFEAGMAPQIGASIVAIQYGLNAPLITLMVGIGTVLSFLTLPIVWYIFAAV